MAAVTLYRGNRVDAAFERDPDDLVAEFVNAVRDGYDLTRCRRGFEFAYRWWLTDPEAVNASWDARDDDALLGALGGLSNADRDLLWAAMTSAD